MKYLILSISTLIVVCLLCLSCNEQSTNNTQIANRITKNVDPTLFQKEGVTITIETCELSNGTTTDCYKIVSSSTPTDHKMGPWCPTNISDGAEKGGIWLENGEVHNVDGAFVKNMASFYSDPTWKMYDENGNIFITDTKAACEAAANPNVGAEYKNFCVECLPSYVTDIHQTYYIPITPVALPTRNNTKISGRGPRNIGLAFNGVRFDAPAPTNAILSAYTLAPFDDAGGHINLNAGYHYHAATGKTKSIVQVDDHAGMIGYAMDGYSIFEQLDKKGTEPTDLDDCRGHYDEIRGYHYHVAAPGTNSFINCLNGASVSKNRPLPIPLIIGGISLFIIGSFLIAKYLFFEKS